MANRRYDDVVDVIEMVQDRSMTGTAELASLGGGFGYPMPGGYGSSPPGGMGVTSQGFGEEGYVLDTTDIGPRPRPSPAEENFAVGVPYYLPFATPYRDSWEIFREDPVTIRQLISMRRQDGQARALYRLITMPILAALRNSTIAPPEEYEPASGKPAEDGVAAPGLPPEDQEGTIGSDGAEEETEFIHNLFFLPASAGGMTRSFNHFIRRLLLATFDGFSGFEMVYWVPKTGPMKGKITLRKIDWRPAETLTFLLDGQGEFCLTGDTRISQLDGTEVPIREMVRRHEAGAEQWVYSCDKDGYVVPGRVIEARKTSDSEPLLEVELDNGEKVRCTGSHPWMLRDGTYCPADQLTPGMSLMPFYRRARKVSSTTQEYEQVKHPAGDWEFTHRLVSRELGFPVRRGEVIHHWFEGLRHRNNDPSNLERMTRQEHNALHARLAVGAIERARSVTSPEEWGNHSSVTFEDIDKASRAIVSAGKRLTWQAVSEKLGCSQDVIYARVTSAGYASWKAYKWTLSQTDWKRDRKFHRRKELRAAGIADGRRVPVTFEDIDCAARKLKNAGSLSTWRQVAQSLGCDQTVIYARLREQGFAGWATYKASLMHNHKVLSVTRLEEPEAVYDIEVENFHNFALSAGSFVHNSGFRQRTFFQGRTIDVKIPKQRAFYFANSEEERPFYGISLFESAFYHFDKKTKLYYIVHLAAQRAAVGTRIGTMPPNPARQDKANFIAALRDLGMSQYMVVPSADWTVTSLNEAQGRFDYLGLINHHNSQMSKSVLAAWFDNTQGAGQNEGTLVDFGTQNDETFMMMLQAIMDDMARCINQEIIPRFIDWNFGTAKYPEFRWGTLTEEQQAAVQDTFDKLATAPPGAISRQFVLELEKKMSKILGLNIDYGPIEKQAMEQQSMQDKLSKLQMEQQLTGSAVPGQGMPPPPPQPMPGEPGYGAGTSAGTGAGSGQPPGAGGQLLGGQGGPQPPQPPQQQGGGQTLAGFSAQQQAMVHLVGDLLSDIVMRKEDGSD